MQQTSSRPITAVHVWQTFNFGIGLRPAPLSGNREKILLLLHWGNRTCPQMPVTQFTPQRDTNTESALVLLSMASHPPSQALMEEEGPRRDPLLRRNNSHEKRDVTNPQSFPHSLLFYKELGFWRQMESAGISPHYRGISSYRGVHVPSAPPRRPSDPVEGTQKLTAGTTGWFSFLQLWAAWMEHLMYWCLHCSIYTVVGAALLLLDFWGWDLIIDVKVIWNKSPLTLYLKGPTFEVESIEKRLITISFGISDLEYGLEVVLFQKRITKGEKPHISESANNWLAW